MEDHEPVRHERGTSLGADEIVGVTDLAFRYRSGDFRLDAMVVVPICPHKLTDRPIVVAAGPAIEIEVLERKDTKAEVTVDGLTIGQIRPGERLKITPADRRIRLIHPPGHDFYEILRNKLFWGRDSRVRDGQGT